MQKLLFLIVIVLLALLCTAAAPPRPIPPVRRLPGENAQGGAEGVPSAHSDETVSRVAPYAAAPACAHHDPRAYHSLWNSVEGCHYSHTHGDDPHEVDDIFSASVYEWAGGEISYPWQTPDENRHKHGAYMWFVRRDLPCGENATGEPCIADFRAQFHGVGAAHGAVTSFHSAWLEARVCAGTPWRCGLVRVGGWQGPVDLHVDGRVVLDREQTANRFFLHYLDSGNRAFGTWYTGAASGLYSVIPQFEDMWNTVPVRVSAEEIVSAAHWFCAGETGAFADLAYESCAANSSRVQPHIIRIALPPRMLPAVDPDGDGLADYEGFVDRSGEIAPACTAPGAECIPFVLEGVPYSSGEFQHRGQVREYDLCFDVSGALVADCLQGTPSGWIRYPIH